MVGYFVESSMKVAIANPSTAQSNTALVTGRANYSIEVYWIYVSSDTQLTLTLEGASNVIVWRQYVAARGGHVISLAPGQGQKRDYLAKLVASTDLDYSTSTAGNVFVAVGYDEVPA